jgi:hypothetical protein
MLEDLGEFSAGLIGAWAQQAGPGPVQLGQIDPYQTRLSAILPMADVQPLVARRRPQLGRQCGRPEDRSH